MKKFLFLIILIAAAGGYGYHRLFMKTDQTSDIKNSKSVINITTHKTGATIEETDSEIKLTLHGTAKDTPNIPLQRSKKRSKSNKKRAVSSGKSRSFHGNSSEPTSVRGITHAHNKYRRKYGIDDLQWSPKLAKIAQEWAEHLAIHNNCKMKHRSHSAPKYHVPYGENLYWSSSLGKYKIVHRTANNVVKAWYDEVIDYNYDNNSCKPGKVCGHYTQVIWKKSKYVGCGMIICDNKEQLWVCNYDPPGNYRGQKPY